MRHASDALLTGIGTVLDDDPALTDRTGLPRRRKLLRVVLDARLRLPARSKLVRSARGDLLIFTATPAESPQARRMRAAGVEIVRVAARRGRIDLGAVLDELGSRGALQVLVEGGAHVAHDFHAAGLIDRYVFYVAPALGGGDDGRPVFAGAGAPTIEDFWRGRLVSVERLGDDLRVEVAA